MPAITPFLWFEIEAEEAARFYISVFPNSEITEITHYGDNAPMPKGTVLTVAFALDGHPFVALNGSRDQPFNHAVSFAVACASQVELDSYWEKLGAGGKEIACGWLTDKFGLAWQIVPAHITKYFSDSESAKSQAVMQAMMGMVKLDIAALEKAWDDA